MGNATVTHPPGIRRLLIAVVIVAVGAGLSAVGHLRPLPDLLQDVATVIGGLVAPAAAGWIGRRWSVLALLVMYPVAALSLPTEDSHWVIVRDIEPVGLAIYGLILFQLPIAIVATWLGMNRETRPSHPGSDRPGVASL